MGIDPKTGKVRVSSPPRRDEVQCNSFPIHEDNQGDITPAQQPTVSMSFQTSLRQRASDGVQEIRIKIQ